MMKLVVFFAVLATSLARSPVPGGDPKNAQILRLESDTSPEGSYQYAFETDNGITGQEKGSVHPKGPGEADITVTGQSSYTNPEGELVQLSYVADEHGFQPTGSHLPVSAPIPLPIQRALEYIAAHPPVQEPSQGAYQKRF